MTTHDEYVRAPSTTEETTMQAIVHTRFGAPADVLELREVARPEPGDGEALVRVRAAGLHRGDWLIARGQPYVARPSYGFRTPKHPGAGIDVAGVVEAIGAGVTGFAPGDEVFGFTQGAFAEYAVVAADALAPKPAAIGFDQAAVVPTSGFAALQAVRDAGEVRSGQKVLVIGASGGVGGFAVQIAKAIGAEVTGVASTKNLDMVRSLGADHVIDYTQERIGDGGRRFDVIIDTAGNRSLSELRGALVPKGTLVIVGGTGGKWLMGFGRTIRGALLSPFVGHRIRPLLSKPTHDDLLVLQRYLEDGALTPVIDRTYPLDAVPEAVGRFEGGHGGGKAAITV
jgi:NADPH:quinone reductase-like Zn-dependent oxidoreductase